MSFRCLKCKAVFRDPADSAPELDQTTVYCGIREPHYTCEDVCPECSSRDIEEFAQCEMTGCKEEAEDGDDYCTHHIHQLELEEA